MKDLDRRSTTTPVVRRTGVAVLLAILVALLWFEPPAAPVDVAPAHAQPREFSAQRSIDWLASNSPLAPRANNFL